MPGPAITIVTGRGIAITDKAGAGAPFTVVSSGGIAAQLVTSGGIPVDLGSYVPGGGDVTAPTLSSPTGAQTGSTTATVGVTTNEANGTLYRYVSTSSTPPSAANLKSGSGAVVAGSQAISSTGAKTASITGLTASTTYYTHWLHRDAAGNDSAIATGSGFTTAAATPTAISAVTLAQTSVAGSSPFNWSISIPDATIYAGQFWRVQVATDSGFTAITQNFTQIIVPGDFVSGPTFGSFITPSGLFYLRMRVEQDEGVTPATSDWSNTLSDTIVASSATLVTTNGVNKSSFVTVTGTPALTFTANNGSIGSAGNTMVRTLTEAANSKFHYEVTVNSIASVISCGIVDLATAVGGAGTSTIYPGNGALPGCTVRFGTASATPYRNGGAGSANASAGLQVGDVIVVEGDKATNTVNFYRRRAGVTSPALFTLTLTSNIPSVWHAFVGVSNANLTDSGTVNFGATAFASTPTSGYGIYG